MLIGILLDNVNFSRRFSPQRQPEFKGKRKKNNNTSPNRLLVLSVYLYLLQLLGYSLFISMFPAVLCLGGLRGGACGHVGAQRVWSVLCGVRCAQRK